ncbi:hypothetical protein Tco_0322030 [Tanacetum coccineum]
MNDSDTVSEVHHHMFENVFANGIQSHEQPESIPDTYNVNENNSNIISDIPNMDPDSNKEEHDDVAYEQQHAFLAFLINNLKCDVEKYNKVNPKELVPCLYNIDEMGKDELSDPKIISKEELKCEAKKRLKVKHRKSPLSYHAQLRDHDPKLWNSLSMKYFCYIKQTMLKFETETFSKLQLSQDALVIMSFEQSINMRVRNRLSGEFEPLVKDVNLQLSCFEKGLVKEMKDDLKYVMSLEDEFDETCLILDIQQEFFKTKF